MNNPEINVPERNSSNREGIAKHSSFIEGLKKLNPKNPKDQISILIYLIDADFLFSIINAHYIPNREFSVSGTWLEALIAVAGTAYSIWRINKLGKDQK